MPALSIFAAIGVMTAYAAATLSRVPDAPRHTKTGAARRALAIIGLEDFELANFGLADFDGFSGMADLYGTSAHIGMEPRSRWLREEDAR